MASRFTFPPPPPPPPLPLSAPNSTPERPNYSDRGKGRWQTRGRGWHSTRGHGRAPAPRRSADWDRPQQNQGGQPSRPYFYTSSKLDLPPGQKRNLSQAFQSSSQSSPGGNAPPPVPSFALPVPVPAKPPIQTRGSDEPKRKKGRKFNQLGLTPQKEEHESSEEEDDDADEESRLAAAIPDHAQYGGLRFEHNGEVVSLSTPQEIKAWIAERKRRFPTKARIEETQAAKAKLQNKAKPTSIREDRQGRRHAKGKQLPHKNSLHAARQSRGQAETTNKRNRGLSSIHMQGVIDSSISSDESTSDRLSDDDTNSTSGSSSGSDSTAEGPIEKSSKVPVPPLDMVADKKSQDVRSPKVCRHMLRSGKCAEGKQCRFRHDFLSDEYWSKFNNELAESKEFTKTTLYERLLVQQNDQEDREVLRLIRNLGNRGLLADQ